jgi:hypothetical protein
MHCYRKDPHFPHRGNFCSPEGDGRNFLCGGSVVIVNVLGHPKEVGELTSNCLLGGGMEVFWNDPIHI